jgi:hypothetical protein
MRAPTCGLDCEESRKRSPSEAVIELTECPPLRSGFDLCKEFLGRDTSVFTPEGLCCLNDRRLDWSSVHRLREFNVISACRMAVDRHMASAAPH